MTKRPLVVTGLMAALIVAGGVVHNNCSWQRVSRPQFETRLDHGLEQGIAWVDAHAGPMLAEANPALFHMLADMHARAHDPRLARLVAAYLGLPGDSIWRKAVDPRREGRLPLQGDIDRLQDYQRWMLFALAAPAVTLTDEDRASMFAPDAHHWGSLTHQLLAVHWYRISQGASPETDALVRHLCKRIATEATWDLRVTDLYLQRTSFLLAAGCSDLVERRWVERILDNQEPDGGWTSSWHGWGPALFRFTWRPQSSNPHTTVQGIWALHLARHRYPHWIRGQFPGG